MEMIKLEDRMRRGRNLFADVGAGPSPDGPERFEDLLKGSGAFRVERIVSGGQATPDGEWYDQDWDEWVAVLEGSARLRAADGGEVDLRRGDTLFLPRHVRHRVVSTSAPCVWLAVHGDALEACGDGQ